MYRPKTDDTIWEIRGSLINPYDRRFDSHKYLFGYSRINGYDNEKKIAYAKDVGKWVKYEDIYNVNNATLKYKRKKVVAYLSRKQLKMFKGENPTSWLIIENTLKDMREMLETDTIFKDILEKYVLNPTTEEAEAFLRGVVNDNNPHPAYMVTALGVSNEDYKKLVRHYSKTYDNVVTLPEKEYFYKAYRVIKEILNKPDTDKPLSYDEIDKLGYGIYYYW